MRSREELTVIWMDHDGGDHHQHARRASADDSDVTARSKRIFGIARRTTGRRQRKFNTL
jgi:hypothetical protein